MAASSGTQEVSLSGGTVIGRVEEWGANPGVFNGWAEIPDGTSEVAVEGVSRDRAELEIVRQFLLREIKIQEKADQSSPEAVERNRRIQEGFQMQRSLTEKIIREEEGAA